jgi:Rrf2 family protein
MSMSLTRAVDYGVRAMVHIASLPPGTIVLRSDVTALQHIPPSFGAKILRRLTRAGILDSARGINGGYTLARPAEAITLLDVVEAIDGPLTLVPCSGERNACALSDGCPASLVWPVIQHNLREMLRGLDLERLVSSVRRQGRVAAVPGLVTAIEAPRSREQSRGHAQEDVAS